MKNPFFVLEKKHRLFPMQQMLGIHFFKYKPVKVTSLNDGKHEQHPRVHRPNGVFNGHPRPFRRMARRPNKLGPEWHRV